MNEGQQMKASSACLEFIKGFEKLRLTAYLDGGGRWTIGYGHTRSALSGMQISEARALMLFGQDVAEVEEAINRLVRVPLDQCQFDALVTLVFNIGKAAFAASTILRLINSRADPMQVAAEFLRWVYDNGKKIRGLERRRAAERLMYLGGA